MRPKHLLLLALGAAVLALSAPVVRAGELDRAVALLEAAEQKPELKSLEEAERLFQSVCQGPNRNAHCEYYLARVYLAEYSYWSQTSGDPDRADAALAQAEAMGRQAVARRPNDASVHVLLGKIYQFKLARSPVSGMGQALLSESPVLAEYNRALELDPQNGEAELGLGVYYHFMPRVLGGDAHVARQHFRRASKLMRSNPEPLVWIAISYREEGRLTDARQALTRALALDPQNAFALAEDERLRAAEKAAP
jgi:tetratricopeptide (TPR) repeat protein